jgi:hypothetical protein
MTVHDIGPNVPEPSEQCRRPQCGRAAAQTWHAKGLNRNTGAIVPLAQRACFLESDQGQVESGPVERFERAYRVELGAADAKSIDAVNDVHPFPAGW